jgi:hypothetical protein
MSAKRAINSKIFKDEEQEELVALSSDDQEDFAQCENYLADCQTPMRGFVGARSSNRVFSNQRRNIETRFKHFDSTGTRSKDRTS